MLYGIYTITAREAQLQLEPNKRKKLKKKSTWTNARKLRKRTNKRIRMKSQPESQCIKYFIYTELIHSQQCNIKIQLRESSNEILQSNQINSTYIVWFSIKKKKKKAKPYRIVRAKISKPKLKANQSISQEIKSTKNFSHLLVSEKLWMIFEWIECF